LSKSARTPRRAIAARPITIPAEKIQGGKPKDKEWSFKDDNKGRQFATFSSGGDGQPEFTRPSRQH
jgi:hypothetical protein